MIGFDAKNVTSDGSTKHWAFVLLLRIEIIYLTYRGLDYAQITPTAILGSYVKLDLEISRVCCH
eukprot:15364754-Ditylum_brightwellii.AAC.1